MHPDEPKIVRSADAFPRSLEIDQDYRYPHLLHNALGLTWWPLRVAQGFPGEARDLPGEVSYERALVFCRAVMVLVYGLGGMLLLAAFARSLGLPRAVPWVIAASCAQPFIVGTTALAQTDVSGAFMLFALFYGLLRTERAASIGLRHAVLLGCLQGLAVATRYVNLVGAVGCLIVGVVLALRGRIRLARLPVFICVWILSAAAALVLAMPGVILHTDAVLQSLEYERMSKLNAPLFDPAEVWAEFRRCLPLWILVPGLVGAVVVQRRTRTITLPALGVCLAIYFATVLTALKADYVAPAMPVIAVCVGVLCERVWRSGGGVGRAVAACYLCAGIALSGWAVVQRYRADTLYRVNAWLHETVPPSGVGLAPAAAGRGLGSPLLPSGYEYVSVHTKPEWLIVPDRQIRQVSNLSQDPAYYESAGFVLDLDTMSLGNLAPQDFAFYDRLLAGRKGYSPFGESGESAYKLVRTFERSRLALDMAPARIEIWRRK